MPAEKIKKHGLPLAIALFVVVLLVAFFIFFRSVDDPTPPEMDRVTAEAETRPRWAAPDHAPRLEVRHDGEGFALGLPEGPSLLRMPLPTGLEEPTWDAQQRGTTSILSLRGTLRGAAFLASWVFVEGDPQVAFTATLTDLPTTELEHVIGLSMEMEADSARIIDGSLRMRDVPLGTEEFALHWIGLELDEAHITLSTPRATDLRITRRNENMAIDLILWDGDHSPWPDECQNEDARLDLHARTMITIGAAPAFAVSPLPSGFEAALVPMFTEPLDRDLRPGAARDAEDWMARARTLLYGHSSPEDPRYGNGGLLGSNFGGVLALPEHIWEDPSVQAWTSTLFETRVDLVPQDSPPFARHPSPAVAVNDRCPAALEAVQHNRPALFVGWETTPVAELATDPFTPGYPILIEAARLDGRRTSLVEGVLSRSQLEHWTRERGILFFSTPLVATRNPLVGAAEQALLEPEPEGNWTLDPEVARALGRVELLQETRRLFITSPSALHGRAQATRDITLWWNEAGTLVVQNQSMDPLEGFTLAIPGAAEVTFAALDGAVESGQRIEDGDLWIWWDLEPGATYSVSWQAPTLAPVRWSMAP
ncbi:MAG: hypothetical protein ACNA8W_09050 [Bradymonadaceae bacterium]